MAVATETSVLGFASHAANTNAHKDINMVIAKVLRSMSNLSKISCY